MGAVAVIAAVGLAIFLLRPTAPKETIVVLPSADGHNGTVVVQRGDNKQVLDKPYATSRSDEDKVQQLSAEEVKQEFGTTLEALPARPSSFTLYFITGTDELTPESKADLQNILAALKDRPLPDVQVIGHTDTVGDLLVNDRLSAQRAETVKGFLVEIGIPAGRITTAGRGEREPIVRTPDETDEPRNRRVEINVR
ncbi:MAG: OmpA family protein [Betaproteobacteria bacterium]|nr:OmpA family protein [Betaproteobacteria bacterium]